MAKFAEFEVKTFREHAYCDCGKGELLPAGFVLTSNPPQYAHQCNTCGAQANLRDRYPRHITRPVER